MISEFYDQSGTRIRCYGGKTSPLPDQRRKVTIEIDRSDNITHLRETFVFEDGDSLQQFLKVLTHLWVEVFAKDDPKYQVRPGEPKGKESEEEQEDGKEDPPDDLESI